VQKRGGLQLPVDPYSIVCEILGLPAWEMRDPVSVGYECPFINSVCTKRSQRLEGPYPVCTVYRGHGSSREPVIVCPKRFYEADLFSDVIRHCWGGEPPANPVFVHEVKMGEFGMVDFVVADLDTSSGERRVKEFVSVEIQAVDITGSCEPAYTVIVLGQPLQRRPTYGFNYANVRKRYISQLIAKGFFHHHWGTRIVAVVQDIIYNSLRSSLMFSEARLEESNILFMRYKMVSALANGSERFRLSFDGVVGTTHSALMTSTIYKRPPSKDEFCRHILMQLSKG
jgi:hypothetical protein